MAEITFEYFALALEAAGIANRGVPVTPPTHYINLAGALTPQEEIMQPDESRGTLEQHYRSKRVREFAEFECTGGLDLDLMPLVLAHMLRGGMAVSSVPGSAIARLWDAIPVITQDDIRTSTIIWGTPDAQNLHMGAFGVFDSLEIAADATGTDGTTMTIGGFTQSLVPLDVSPALPAQLVGDLVVPGDWQVWLNEQNGNTPVIGTTPLEGEVISVTHTLENNIVRKFIPRGPGQPRTYTRIGRGKRHLRTVVGFEVPNNTRYKQWRGEVPIALRVRHNGEVIDEVNGNPLYSYLQVDTFGKWRTPAWGEYEGTNRRLDLTILSEVSPAGNRSFAMQVMNTRSVL